MNIITILFALLHMSGYIISKFAFVLNSGIDITKYN